MRVRAVVLFAVAVLGLVAGDRALLAAEPGEAYRGLLVAHALGAIDGHGYTNSPTALDYNYKLGRRWFEVDLALTSDRKLVCFHTGKEADIALDGREISSITEADFLSRQVNDRFALMTFRQLVERAEALGDITIVTDTKTWNRDLAMVFEKELAAAPESVRRRVVPQLYHVWEIGALRGIEKRLGPFRSIILTLYQTKLSDENVVSFVKKEHIPIVTMNTKRFSPKLASDLHGVGALVLVHTLNDHKEIARFAENGADGFYVDFYRPYSDFFPDVR